MLNRRSFIALLLALNITLINSNNVYSSNNFNNLKKEQKNITIENANDVYKNLLVDKELDYFKNKKVFYAYEKSYISRQEISKMLKNLNYHKKCSEINELSASEIVANIAIKSNESETETLKSVFKSPDSFGFQVILNMIIEDIINNETNDINEDLSIINNLKIQTVPFEFTEQYLDVETKGMHYDESLNTIFIHRDSLFSNNEKIESKEYYDTLAKNLVHVINDIRQISVNDINYLKYNNLYNPLFLEDASTRYPQIYKKFDIKDDSSYILENDQKLLLLLSLFSKNRPKELYNAIFDEDAKRVFDILNLKSEEDIYDFYKVMYAVDAPAFKNDFFLNYKTDALSGKYSIDEALGYSYKETIYNDYVTNLLSYLQNNDLSLEENLTIYYLGFNLISDNVNIESTNFNINNSINNLKESHNHYLEFIKNYYNIDNDDLNILLYTDVQNNLLSLQKDFNIEKVDVSSYYKKFPMLKLFSNSIIPTFAYENITGEEKVLSKEL